MNNKTKDINNLKIFSKYPGYIDLYQIALHTVIGADEGIIIVPINFWTAERSSKIRKEFLSEYEVKEVKLFYYQVFEDTDYSVCSFYFHKKKNEEQTIKFRLMLDEKNEDSISLKLFKENSYSININLKNNPTLKLDRVSKPNEIGATNIKLHLTDSKPNSYGIFAEITDVYY